MKKRRKTGKTRRMMGPCLSVTSRGLCKKLFLSGKKTRNCITCLSGGAVAVVWGMSKACRCSGAGISNGVMVERDNLLRCVFSLIRIRNI